MAGSPSSYDNKRTGILTTTGSFKSIQWTDGNINSESNRFEILDSSRNLTNITSLSASSFISASSAAIDDLTSGRIVLAGTGGTLEDSGNLLFDGSQLTVDGDISGSGNIEMDGNADISGTLDVSGISTLGTVTASAGYFTNNLDVDNALAVDGTLSASGQADFAAAMNVGGAATFSSTMEVSGISTLAVLTASAGRFSSDLTVVGNLSVQGTTTTVNSSEVTIGDRIIELNTSGASGDAGLFVRDADNSATGSLLYDTAASRWKGGESGSLSILVDRGSNESITGTKTFSSLTASSADINGGAIDATTIGADTAADGKFTTLSASTGLSASSARISGLSTDNGIVHVNSNGDLEVDVGLKFDGSQLDVAGAISGSGQADFGAAMNVAGAASFASTVSAANKLTITANGMEVTGAASFSDDVSSSANIYGDSVDAASSFGVANGQFSADDSNFSVGTDMLVEFESAITGNAGMFLSAALDMNDNYINNLADPSNDQDAATKAYVDSQLTSQVVTISSSNGNGEVDLDSEAIFFSGTANEIDVQFDDSTKVVKYGLPQDVTISQDLTVARNLVVSGNVELGNVSGDTISANGRFDTNLMPSSTLDMGDDDNRWGDIYATNMYTGDLHMKNERGDWTLFEESDHIRIRNNATGQEFKLNMTPVEE